MNDMIISDAEFSKASCRIASIFYHGVRLFKEVSQQRMATLLDFWNRNEYLLIEDSLTEAAKLLLMQHITYDSRVAQNDPDQFHRIHNDADCQPFVDGFLAASQIYYSAILSTRLIPEYGFAMQYVRNSDMNPHYDNLNNPVSSTACYHFTPNGLSNPIYVDRARFENPYIHRVTIRDRDGIPRENVAEIHLRAGDIAIFRGRNHLHWRKFVAEDMDYRAILLHFSDYVYKGEMVRPSRNVPQIGGKMLDFEGYDDFRREYVMYFQPGGNSWT